MLKVPTGANHFVAIIWRQFFIILDLINIYRFAADMINLLGALVGKMVHYLNQGQVIFDYSPSNNNPALSTSLEAKKLKNCNLSSF